MKVGFLSLSFVVKVVLVFGQDVKIVETESRSTGYYHDQRLGPISSCAVFQTCLPLSQCSDAHYEVAKSCLLIGDRSAVCGYTDGSEPLICCNRRVLLDAPETLQQHYAPPSAATFATYNPTGLNSVACGRSLVQSQIYRGLGAFPFVARIGFKNVNTGSMAYPCTGSIITRRVILTAAHCALARADGHKLSSVRVGEYDSSKDPDCTESGFCAPPPINHLISHVIVHPDYVAGQYHHDVALLILRTSLNFTVATQPICLQQDKQDLVVGRRTMIFGWGKMSTTTVRLPEIQYLDLPLVPWDMCLRVYGSTGALDSPQSVEGQWLCAGGEAKDACQGFGGAPLVVKEQGIYKQVGVMSFGSDNCGGSRIPSVYSAISYFYAWIQENIPLSD